MSVLLVFLLISKGSAQDCISDLRATYQILIDKYEKVDFSTFHAKYTIVQERWDGSLETLAVELFSDGAKHYLFSEDYIVCADSLVTVSIQHKNETIFLGSSPTFDSREKGIRSLLGMQINLMTKLQESKCEEISIDGKKYTRITTIWPEKFHKTHQVHKVIYDFSLELEEIPRTEIISTENNIYKRTIIEIELIEINVPQDILKKNPKDFILQNDELVAKYKDYKIKYFSGDQELPSLNN